MSDPRQALEAVEYLASRYRTAAEALEGAANALRELVETGELTEQRRQAMELVRPHLSPEALASVGLAPSGYVIPPQPKRQKDKRWLGRSEPRETDFGLD